MTVSLDNRALRALRVVALLGAGVAAFLSLGAGPQPQTPPKDALARGNALVQSGELEEAVAAYRRGFDAESPHPTLVYNLGAVLHRLDRLPEAVLWYRRSPTPDDPWLEENLFLARRSLGSQQLAAGPVGELASHAGLLGRAGVVLAWIFLVLAVAVPRLRISVLLAVGLVALGIYAAAFGLHRWGPRPAVLLEDCSTAAGELPAGTEAWVYPSAGEEDEEWRVAGTDGASCGGEAVALIRP